MTTIDFITQSFCCVDDKLRESGPNHKHSQAKLYPSEVVTLALLYALKGCGREGITVPLFPSLPHPTRLFRLFNSHGHHLEDFCLPSLTRDTMPSSWFPGQSPRINDSCTSKNMGRLTRPYKSKNLYTPCQPLHLDPPG